MWLELVSFFLGTSLVLYCLLGGADFGAGILEIFMGKHHRKEQKELITHAMGPVWEANHMWLILAVVILFNGFPRAFSALSITYHIPLSLMLVGVILRGCAFTFRHYDAIQDGSQKYYSIIFRISSVMTPLFLGMIAGGLLLGKSGDHDYYGQFIAPWWNLFSLATGIFLCSLFTFLASVYLIGEAEGGVKNKLRDYFIHRAFISNVTTVITGLFVFISATLSGLDLLTLFFNDIGAVSCMVLATLLLFPLWRSLKKQHTLVSALESRALAAAQVICILLGWFRIQFPTLIAQTQSAKAFTLYNSAAPESTLKYLGYALLWGSCLIFPFLFYLLKIFKQRNQKTNEASGPFPSSLK